MNAVYLLIELIIVYGLMILFYRIGKKDGLFLYIVLMTGILSTVIFKTIDIFSFEINLGLTIIMGIFTANNVIIQRYGLDERKKIINYFIISFLGVSTVISLLSMTNFTEYDLVGNGAYDSLFGYNMGNIRLFVSCFAATAFMLFLDGEIYYAFRKSKNNLIFSNIGTILIIQFIESVIFIYIAYVGSYDFLVLFGMMMIRYLLKVIIGGVSLAPVYLLVKKEK